MIIKNKILEPCEWPLVLDILNLCIHHAILPRVFGHALPSQKLCVVYPCEGLSSTLQGLKDTFYQQERVVQEAAPQVSYKSKQPMPILNLRFDTQPSLSVHIQQVWNEWLVRI